MSTLSFRSATPFDADAVASVYLSSRKTFVSFAFLAEMQGLLDCEPCIRVGEVYELEGLPPGTCPPEPTGSLGGQLLRCTSWEAILWDYFYYIEEIPQSEWRPKDFSSFALARESFGEIATQNLHEQFKHFFASPLDSDVT